MSDTLRKIAGNTIYQIVGKVFSMCITIGITILVTRHYGRIGFGEFSLMQNWPALLFVVVDFGFNAIATRELTKDFSKASVYLTNVMLFRVLLSFVLMLGLSVALIFFPYSVELKTGIRLGLFLILTQSLFTTTNIFFQVKLRYDLSVLSTILGYIAIVGLVYLCSVFHLTVMWVNFSYVLGGLLTFLLNALFLKNLGVRFSWVIDKDLLKYLTLNSLPLGFMFIFSQINFKADSILLSVLKLPVALGLNNTESVAIYSLPYKIFEVALVVPTFLMNSVYPVLVRHMEESKERLSFTFNRTMWFLFASGVISGLIGVLLSPLAIRILGGPEFTLSIPVLRILLAGLVLYYMTQPLAWLIVTLGYQRYLPLIYLISAVFNVTANVLFIPVYSFYSSAFITHLSELLILFLLVYYARKSWKQKYS